MSETVLSIIIGFISDYCKDAFSGFWGKIKLWRLKKRLSKEIFQKILKKYGNEVYYNDLDHFLTDHDVICSIIRSCSTYSPFEHKSQLQTVRYYVSLFVDEYPKFSRYHYEVHDLIRRYYEVIFTCLTPFDSNSTRAICATIHEIIGELSANLESIESKIDTLNRKIDMLTPEKKEPGSFCFDGYYGYLLNRYPASSYESYLPRKLYGEDEKGKEELAINVLLAEKRVLVLGEAGYGKTYECIRLLSSIYTDENASSYIPVFFSLLEYGMLYTDIISGIKYKLSSFFDGDPDSVIDKWVQNGKFVFIFDGLDDISSEDFRTKFVSELIDFSARYSSNLFFVTSRFNRYHEELGSFKTYYLTKIDEMTIRHVLIQEGITIQIPQNYYELFSNPYYLELGKRVLKKHNNRGNLFNRSELFGELFRQLYGGIDLKKGKNEKQPVSYSEAVGILGKLAFENFSIPIFSYLQFDKELSRIVSDNRAGIINSFISSGLFNCREGVSFSHKLLKEYCAACYLISTHPLTDNKELYRRLICSEEWKEVFIFAGGLFDQIVDQDCFLDFVMENNLPLYVECVNAKSDLHYDDEADYDSSALRLLSAIHSSYTYIILHYFEPIVDLFSPSNSSQYSGEKVGIIGSLSEDRSHLTYWLDLVPNDSPSVICVKSSELRTYREVSENRAIIHRRNLMFCSVNLSSYGFSEESGRSIALNLIKHTLKNLVNHRKLIESEFLLCERIAYAKKKIKELKDVDNIPEMLEKVNNLISLAKTRSTPGIVAYNHNGVDMFALQSLLEQVNNLGVSYEDCLLPGRDLSYEDLKHGWTWELYSKNQAIKRVSQFFYFHDLSYQKMVLANFPRLCTSFSRYQDYPYQTVGLIDFQDDIDKKEYRSCPVVSYYCLAANEDDVPFPQIREGEDDDRLETYKKRVQEIQDSFSRHGRKTHRMIVSSTAFTAFISSIRTGLDDPLSDFVYQSIEESLEEVFGRL